MPLKKINDWRVSLGLFARYSLYRAGLARKVPFTDHPLECSSAAGDVLQWKKRLRVVGAEHCPKQHPAVFACNHIRFNDPAYLWPAIFQASEQAIVPGFMMRNDFFSRGVWPWLPWSANELCEMTGAVLISRNRFQLAQMKPLLDRLEEPGSFMLFPGGTRTRSGLAMEYHNGRSEPGSVAFFLVHAQRRGCPPVAAVPVARTPNPVTGRGVVAFGPAQYIDAEADRVQQKEFDADIAVRIAQLIEIHALHLVSSILYLRALHQTPLAIELDALTEAVISSLRGLEGRHIDPALHTAPRREVAAATAYLARWNLLRLNGNTMHADRAALLAAPVPDARYRKCNPAKYYANQILHFADVTERMEHAARF